MTTFYHLYRTNFQVGSWIPPILPAVSIKFYIWLKIVLSIKKYPKHKIKHHIQYFLSLPDFVQAHKLSHYLQDIKRNLSKYKNNEHPFIFFDNELTIEIVLVKKNNDDLERHENYSNESNSFHSFISFLTLANSI